MDDQLPAPRADNDGGEPSYTRMTPTRRPHRRLTVVLTSATIAAAAVVLVSIGADHRAQAAAAPTAGSSGSPSASPKPAPGDRPGHGPALGPRGFGGGPEGREVHGQAVVQKPDGTYATVDTQVGSVTAVSTTSITLKSSDGFTMTYAVAASTLVDAQRDGITSVTAGDTARVVATVAGSTATATDIIDQTTMNAAGFGGRHGGGAGFDRP
jgi:hypothetical protein